MLCPLATGLRVPIADLFAVLVCANVAAGVRRDLPPRRRSDSPPTSNGGGASQTKRNPG